jgi:hypothetical protein
MMPRSGRAMAVIDGLNACVGLRREDVIINLVEVKKENWSLVTVSRSTHDRRGTASPAWAARTLADRAARHYIGRSMH